MEHRDPNELSGDRQASSSSSSTARDYTLTRNLRTARIPEQDSIPEPEAAHIPDGILDDEREATELRPQSQESQQQLQIPEGHRRASRILTPSLASQPTVFSPVKRFYRHHIVISVPHVDCRDHLANERTFLGYLRTSVALSMIGVIIAQLWRLQHSPTPDPVFGFYVLSIPISVIFQCSAIVVVSVGGWRFWRQQELMAVGRVKAGGWEVAIVGVGSLSLLTLLFVLHVGVDVRQTIQGR